MDALSLVDTASNLDPNEVEVEHSESVLQTLAKNVFKAENIPSDIIQQHSYQHLPQRMAVTCLQNAMSDIFFAMPHTQSLKLQTAFTQKQVRIWTFVTVILPVDYPDHHFKRITQRATSERLKKGCVELVRLVFPLP
ncbi:hypothetical protein D9758_004597 [Tetrapyrgos nigripes]|uniref:Uncharacterized protein n=1 Tax=Tetrapyrgos nigripes TaxID=182062 RepID=A0A8H5H0J2_9AGAR|nr:hypothetical protein D9758_004597 [Tetrapyrgos nigripes]